MILEGNGFSNTRATLLDAFQHFSNPEHADDQPSTLEIVFRWGSNCETLNRVVSRMNSWHQNKFLQEFTERWDWAEIHDPDDSDRESHEMIRSVFGEPQRIQDRFSQNSPLPVIGCPLFYTYSTFVDAQFCVWFAIPPHVLSRDCICVDQSGLLLSVEGDEQLVQQVASSVHTYPAHGLVKVNDTTVMWVLNGGRKIGFGKSNADKVLYSALLIGPNRVPKRAG